VPPERSPEGRGGSISSGSDEEQKNTRYGKRESADPVSFAKSQGKGKKGGWTLFGKQKNRQIRRRKNPGGEGGAVRKEPFQILEAPLPKKCR